jgi:hypothetical protein
MCFTLNTSIWTCHNRCTEAPFALLVSEYRLSPLSQNCGKKLSLSRGYNSKLEKVVADQGAAVTEATTFQQMLSTLNSFDCAAEDSLPSAGMGEFLHCH